MKLNKKLFGLFLAFLSAQQLFASVTIQFEFEALRDSSGNPLLSQTYAVFIADSNKNSVFPSASDLFQSELKVGDYVGDDRIFYSGLIGTDGLLDGTAATITGNDLGLASGDEISGTKWAVYWFPGLSAAPGEDGLQAGQSYGFYHNNEIDPYTEANFGATAAMVMPGEGTVQVLYLDSETEPTSFPSPEDFTANFTVIPEPTAMVLVLLSSAVLLRRRRF